MASGISTSKEQAGKGAPFVSFGTVFNNYFLPDELPDLMDTSVEEQETYSIKKDDVLITRTSETIDELAMSCVATKDYPCATYSGFTKRLRPIKEGVVYSKYIAFYLRGYLFRKAVTNNAFMTLRASFNEDIFSFMKLYLPSYEQQRKIGNMLYAIEQKIQLNKKINDNLLSQILTIYDYWFTQYRFPDAINTKFVNNDILQKSIPNDWDVNTLGSMFTLLRDGTHNPPPRVASGIPLLTGIMFGDNFLDHSVETYITQDDYSAIHSKYEPLAGDLLLTKIGTVGKVNLLMEEDLPIAIHCNSALLRPYDSDVTPFLFAMLKSKTLQAKLKHEVSKTVQEFISLDKLASIIVEVPSRDLQISFSKTITPMIDTLRTKHQESLELLKLRQWLLPMLMNGQTSIND